MGASAFLVFVVPSSPMAQPWAVIGGSSIAALVGVICTNVIPDLMILIPISVALSILMMFLLRCLHPPAAALALLIALNHIGSFEFIVFPVLVNAFILVVTGVLYNKLTGKLYPHLQRELKSLSKLEKKDFLMQEKELKAVLEEYDEVIDITKDDLNILIEQVEYRAHHKKLESIKCKDIMSTKVISAIATTTLDQIWRLLDQYRIKAIPVINSSQNVIGIVTLVDFIKRLKQDARTFINNIHATSLDAEHIMTKLPMTIHEEKSLLDLTVIFCGLGHHHIPVINAKNQLVGIITQSDFIKAINQSIHLDH